MTSALWTPGTYRPAAALPDAERVTLADGRVLRRVGEWPPAGHPSREVCRGWHYAGPRRLHVLATMDETERFGPLLHVSLSYPSRHPDWETIRMVRDAFYPAAADVMMVLPRQEDYVALHDHCFHLWQTPSAWGMR